jgi:thiol:disulfide interchange protein
MPCVFPVLSIKALALARAGTSERSARIEALAYTAGSILTCALLGLVIMLLRIAGAEIGWAFQLQHPGVTLLLALLATGITMNLAGVFELPGLSFSGAPTPTTGAWSSVASGSLTAFLATPCSGPFMAAALGATLVFSPEMSIAIYAGLGFGLALPMLLIAFAPRIRESLPAPGPWMSTFRRSMAVFTALLAIALIWLLGRQAGATAVLEGALLIFMFGVVLGWFGSRQKAGYQGRWLGAAPVAAAVGGLVLLWPSPVPVRANTNGASVQMFSENRLKQLRRQGIPVLIDITADWCLTCKVNERVAIDRPGTRAAFARAGIVILRGDWTNGDPAITRFLASHGRNSIPFYLFYPAGQAPQVLPQLLTPGIMRKLAASEEPEPRDRSPQE